ncbi:MAG: sigma-70 family RNA polymerase sigma factor [Gemmatimonadales bacterium]|nr:sigma-70 family RNA polymerase sigma factor [Gemmatimonadales bacterium]
MPVHTPGPSVAKSYVGVAPEAAAAACRRWYQAYGEPLYNYLRFHVASPDIAEDLTAEVFLRALRKFDRFDPSAGSPRPWLFRIAHNALRDHQRQAKRRPTLSLGSMRDLRCEAPSPEERLLWEEEVAGVLAAVAELPPKDREIIGLCYGSELPISEAGEILGLRDSAARTRLWRALARLRKLLAHE